MQITISEILPNIDVMDIGERFSVKYFQILSTLLWDDKVVIQYMKKERKGEKKWIYEYCISILLLYYTISIAEFKLGKLNLLTRSFKEQLFSEFDLFHKSHW